MKNKTWLYNILLLISIVSGSILLISNGIIAKPVLSNVYNTASSLPHDIVFEFNTSDCEEVYNLQSNLLELGELNKLTLSFQVNGRSASPGLKVVFILNTVRVEFTVDLIFNDGAIHNLTETFLFPYNYTGSMDITVICTGRSTSTIDGFLTILNTTTIEQMNIPTISKDSSLLPISQDWVMFKGYLFSWNAGGITSAFHNYNEIDLVSLNLSFFSNYFQSVENLVKVSLNGILIAEDHFLEDSKNDLNIQFQPEIGLNLLTLNFFVAYTSHSITVSNITLFGSLFHYETTSSALDSFTWEGSDFTYSFDLSSLKPPGYYSEQILQLTINYQCFGMKIFSGINYLLKTGTTILKEGTISYIDQMYESNNLKIDSFTEEYHNSLSFIIQGSSSGVGGFTILKSSTIEIANIKELTNQPMSRLVADERNVDGPSILTTISFYDVIQTTKGTSFVELAVNFNILSDYEHPFDLLTIAVKINGSAELSQNVYELGFTNFSKTLHLLKGYHEIKISLQFFAINSPLTLEHLIFQIALIEEEVIISSSPSYAPHSSYYLLGFYALLYLILDFKELLRGRIKRKETDDDKDSTVVVYEDGARLRAILVIPIHLTISLGPFFLFQLLGIRQWFIFPLSLLIAIHFGVKILFSNITKDTFIEFWKKTKEFFEDIYSLSEFFSESVSFFRKLSFKSLTKFLVFLIAYLNFGLLFFLTDNIPSNADKGVWNLYALVLACIFISSSTLYYTLHFVRNMAFVEDNLRRIKRFGYLSITLTVGSLIVLVIMLDTKLSLSSIWGFLSPVLIVGIFRSTTKLGKIAAKEKKQSYDDFLDIGRFLTDKKEMRKAISYGIVTRSSWEKKKYELQRNQIIGVITYDLNPSDEIHLFELAEKTNIQIETTKKLIQEIETIIPRLGAYDSKSRVYTKSKRNDIESVNVTGKIVPDKYEPEEKNVEMSKAPKKNSSTKERFQQLHKEIVGESDEEKRRTLEYVHHLTPKEAAVYLKFLNRGLGEQDIVMTGSDREFLQRAWKKMHVLEDIFHRNSSNNLLREYYDKISNAHNGFDDVVFEIKGNETYEIAFLDYKVGDSTVNSPWYYTPKSGYHLKRRELNRKQLFHYFQNKEMLNTRLLPFEIDQKDLENSSLFIKFLYDRNRNYYAIGNDWLIKFRNKDFKKAMAKLVEQNLITKEICEKIILGLVKQNEIISLAQNGHIIKVLLENKNTVKIDEHTSIKFNGESVKIDHTFFLPELKEKNNKTYITLRGFTNPKTEDEKLIQTFISEKLIEKNISETNFLILYSNLKRQFLVEFFDSRKLDELKYLHNGRGLYGLDALVSNDFRNKIERLKKQPDTQRGISWFYDLVQPVLVDFVNHKQLVMVTGRDEFDSLYDELVYFLSDTEGFFDKFEDYLYSNQLYQMKPSELFLFSENRRNYFVPPTFSFRNNKLPKAGVIVVSKQGKVLHYGKYFKRASIQLEEQDLLLNFPFTWDSYYGYFSFTQKGNKLTNISKIWWKWLEDNSYATPSGSSGKIPSESVLVMLLEWWKKNYIFIKEKIFSDSYFIKACTKNNLTLLPLTGEIKDDEDNLYSLAKVSIRPDNSVQHKKTWKLYSFYNENIIRLINTLESVLCDITVIKRGIDPTSISDWKSWLMDNWLDEFERLKPYFLNSEHL